MPTVPSCVGTYEEGHTTCDGDPRGATEEERVPCAWRNRCAGLQVHCEESSARPEEVVGSVSYETLVSLCEARVEKHEIVAGKPGGSPDEPDPGPSYPTDVAAPETPSRASHKVGVSSNRGRSTKGKKSRRARRSPSNKVRRPVRSPKGPVPEDVLALHAHFETILRDSFPERRFAGGKRVLVKPGTFYPVDRTKGSHYVSWYCVAPRGRDHALACVRFKPRLRCVDIELPIDVDELRAFVGDEKFERLQVKAFDDGQFRCLATKLDREGVALVVETIKNLIEADMIPLPT